jgi:hypothetical protein
VKRFWAFVSLLALVSLPGFAASQKTKNLTLTDTVQVAGKQLKPGQYKLKWEDTNNGATTVTFTQGKDVVATAPAQVKKEKNVNNATMETNTAGGQNQLQRVYSNDTVLDFSNGNTSGM